ncbi:LIC_10190 family membrane protein [Lacinutrix gracilariae]|uniref:LIC_10190 family membrane protein n=1 Tax=Lacinutrix gracilariae TaxID=1747198 RepID=A0ABW5K0H0_9FLAO
MLFILLSWLYILAISSVIGVTINKVLQLKKQDSIITILFGFFGVTLMASIWAIPFAINAYFHVFLLFFTGVLGYLNYKFILAYCLQLKTEIAALTVFFKILLSCIALLILAQSASPPFVIDNESYYIQTIKWLNEYGFVNGLVNLHVFLGQTSGWHILQSAFNFNFIYSYFNDLSALALLLGNVYAIFKLHAFLSKKDTHISNLIFGFFPLWNLFFFPFISAPSPDIAIYVLGNILLHQFVLCFATYSKPAFITVVIFSFFMAFIKLSAVPFCIFSLVLYKRYFIFTKSTTSILMVFGGITLVLFSIKNIIITGNLFFPLQGIESLKTSWSLPENIETYFANYTKPYAYHLTAQAFENASYFTKLKSWLLAPRLHGIFNKVILFLLVVFPFFIYKSQNKKAFYTIYMVAIISMLFLFVTSPQYRFFFPFILCFSLVLVSKIITHKNSIKIVVVISTVLAAIPLFFKVNNAAISNNKQLAVSSTFSSEYIVKPYKNSKYSEKYKSILLNETTIHTPTEVDFFWGTGDIPLPALQQEQLDFFKSHFQVIPQQRTKHLKDGFISKKFQQ